MSARPIATQRPVKVPAPTRPDLSELTLQQIEPLEALMGGDAFPDVWRDFARSLYITLLGLRGSSAAPSLPTLATEAVTLVYGIAQDLGGQQPYIPIGASMASDTRTLSIIDGHRKGIAFHVLAKQHGLTESRVRQILSAWRKEQFGRLQGKLALDD